MWQTFVIPSLAVFVISLALEHIPRDVYVIFIVKGLVSEAGFPSFLFLARKGCVKFPWKIAVEISKIPLCGRSTSSPAPVVCSLGWFPSRSSVS